MTRLLVGFLFVLGTVSAFIYTVHSLSYWYTVTQAIRYEDPDSPGVLMCKTSWEAKPRPIGYADPAQSPGYGYVWMLRNGERHIQESHEKCWITGDQDGR